MRDHTEPITVTDVDFERLRPVLDQHDTPVAESLEAELQRARVVPQRAVPADVVTMNSEVEYEDCTTGVRRTVRVVYPRDADPATGRISVIAPVGAALLGLSVGQAIEWRVPGGTRRLRVVAIGYQPEAAGVFDR